MKPFQDKYFDIGGMKMHYIDEGSGQPLLMLHGNPTWSYFYRELVSHFSGTNRVVAPDHIGMGLSDKPQDAGYCLSFHIENLSRLIDGLGLKDIIMIVHDWGGPIGFGYAVDHVEAIKKIVILNTAAFPHGSIPKRIDICRGRFGRLLVQRLNAFAWAATFMCSEKPLPKEARKMYLAPYSSYGDRIGIYSFVKDIPMEENHRSWQLLSIIESRIPKIGSDILILWGKKDFVFTKYFFDRWRAFYPRARAVLYDDAGHYVLEDKTDEVIEEIEWFIA